MISLIWVVSELADLYLMGWMHNLAGSILKRRSCLRPHSTFDSTTYLMGPKILVPQYYGSANIFRNMKRLWIAGWGQGHRNGED